MVSSFTHLYGDKCFCGNRCTGGPFKCRRCTPTYGKGDFVKGLPRVDTSLYGTGCRRPGFDPEKHSRSDYTVQPKDPPESSKLVWALRSVCHYDLLRPDAHVGRTDFDAIYEQQQVLRRLKLGCAGRALSHRVCTVDLLTLLLVGGRQ